MIKLIISFNALLFSVLAFFGSTEKPKSISDMPMCSTMQDGGINQWTGTAIFTKLPFAKATPSVPSKSGFRSSIFQADETKSYAMPLLTQTPKGEVLMSWMEKDEKGVTAFCFSTSTDKGKTFSDKKVIYSGSGVSSSRLFRAKLLAKKDGSLVAVFPNRSDAPPAAAPAQGQPQAQQGQGGQGGGRGGRGGGGRSMDLVYTVSKDGGNTWTSLQVVDSDPTKAMRGFFDAIILPNDEIAVAYLKDVKNSTKHEERDLRIVITKNGVFQAEKLLDAVVCDCCNINMLVDANGALNVIYRDNDNDIRDFSKMVSTDNGETFSKPQNIYTDGWKIAGCPHNGAISSVNGKGALIAYYSGAESESGFKLVTQEGKKLFVLDDPSVKNPALMGSAQAAAMLWEQGGEKSKLVFRTIKGGKVSETTAVEGSDNASNATGLVIDNQLLIAHEVKQEGKKMSLKIATTNL